MLSDINSMSEAAERFQTVSNQQEFQTALYALQNYMKRIGMPGERFIELERRAYYQQNEYSDKDTKDRMREAAKRVLEYIGQLTNVKQKNSEIAEILENFYLFLENFLERPPHRKGIIKQEQLACIKIGNEYDVQHFLYAYLKPLYPLSRLEVSEDTGYGTVRTDILIDSENVIEIKCTRVSMSRKKLVEEIEADIVHYSASNIYFFIYDKEKLIDNPQVFKNRYESIVKEKNIFITIHQPKIL